MIAHSPNSLCRQAELYYYDFLCDESRGLIPESMVNHIDQCQHCREQIIKLKAALSQADSLKSEQEQVSSAVTTMLKLHFAYIGKPVTCNIAKPFLPTLLDPALGMRITTPIITHLCDCQLCSEDLDIIRSLGLTRKQLCRLSQLFADKPTGDDISCSNAQNAIPSIASMAFNETDSEVLKHVCKCPTCRGLLYKERQKICDSLPEYPQTPEFLCDEVSTTDIFDYVVPYGLDPADDQYAKFRKSFTSHVASCPNCLAKMQMLYNAIYYIAERAESEVVTIYEIDESAKAQAAVESDSLYSAFPIKVKAIKQEDKAKAEQPVSTINFAVALKQRISAMQLKPLAKTAVAAAAVILLAFALFFHTPTAKAVTIEKIYQAIQRLNDVHISTFDPVKTEPVQQTWISRLLNIYMTKTEKQLVLWDVTNGVRKTKYPDAAVTETAPVSYDKLVDVREKMSGSLGLMPFYSISEVPANARWNPIDVKSPEVAAGIEVYDLIWVEESRGGIVVPNKWWVFVDTKTNLPLRAEFYRKQALDSDYSLESIIAVKYLEKGQIESAIKEHSF